MGTGKHPSSLLLILATLRWVEATHPDCSIIQHLEQQEAQCLERIQLENHSSWISKGCWSEWDGVNCWAAVPVGETLSVTCPDILSVLNKPKVLIQRNCTENGWTTHSPPYYTACELSSSGIDTEQKKGYFATVKVLYTCGYAASLAALIIAIGIFSLFRKLYCTRNFIHIHLFASFVFRGAAVFGKDAVLFADEDVDHCTMSTVNCKAAVIFLQYSVLANFSWLLVEGMYLQTLLVFTFISDKQYFWWYIFIGWGTPILTILVWIVTRLQYDDIGCWDDNENIHWWIIKAPILFAIFMNFLIFLNVIRILIQKIRCPDIGTNYKQQYVRLAKSTMLLIPLFGVHYVVFALFPEHIGVEVRVYFELVLGSYQGCKYKKFQERMLSFQTASWIRDLTHIFTLSNSYQQLRRALKTLLFIESFGTLTLDVYPLVLLISANRIELNGTCDIQGFIVALLYCFLNGEVQTEVKRRWRKCRSSMESNVFNLVTQEFTA